MRLLLNTVMFKLSLDELRRLTPPIWCMVISIILSTIVSGCMLLFYQYGDNYQSMETSKLLLTSIVITAPILVINSLLLWSIVKRESSKHVMLTSLTWGGVFTTLLFGLLTIIGTSMQFLWGCCYELSLFAFILWALHDKTITKRVRGSILHIVLFVLNIISFFFILQIVFGLIPLIDSDLSPQRITLINGLIVDLSIGIIISTLFYYLLVYVPEKIRRKQIRMFNQGKLDYLAGLMQVVVAYFSDKYSLVVGCRNLVDVDFSRLPQFGSFNQEQVEFWFSQRENIVTNVEGSTELGFLHCYLKVIKNISNILYASNIFSLDDMNLQRVVLRIRESSLINNTEHLYNNKPTQIFIPSLSQDVRDFFLLYQELAGFVTLGNIVIKGDRPQNSVPIVYS